MRNRLDEIKREEVERIRRSINEINTQDERNRNHIKIPEHLDHQNVHTFEKDDLQKLIFKVEYIKLLTLLDLDV